MSKGTQVHPLVAVLVVAGAIAFFVWVGIEARQDVISQPQPPAAPEIHTAAPETKPDPERVITRLASPQPDPEEVITRLASALKIPDKTLTAVRSDLQLKEPSCSLLSPLEVMGCEVRYGTSSLLACRAAALLLAVRKAADYRWARALAMSTNCSGNWVELDLHIEPSPWVRIMQVMPDRREPVFSGDYGKPSGSKPKL